VIVATGGGAYSLSNLMVQRSLSPTQTPVQLDPRNNALSFRWWFGTILIAASCAYLLWSPSGPALTAQVETTDMTNIGREVLRAEQTTWERFQNRNIDGMLEMIDADFTAFSGSMPLRLDTKKAEEDHIRTFIEKLDGQVLDYKIMEPRVQVLGQAAILTYHFSVSVVLKGQKQTLTGKNTSVWARRDKGWRQVHYHYAYNPGK
jgi:ketosteroid isomerase-like protein